MLLARARTPPSPWCLPFAADAPYQHLVYRLLMLAIRLSMPRTPNSHWRHHYRAAGSIPPPQGPIELAAQPPSATRVSPTGRTLQDIPSQHIAKPYRMPGADMPDVLTVRRMTWAAPPSAPAWEMPQP